MQNFEQPQNHILCMSVTDRIQQSQHITEVMTGIGQQCQRIGHDTINRFNNDKRHVEQYTHCESPVVIGWRMVMVVVDLSVQNFSRL